MIKKGLVFGIVVLFIGMSSMPLAGSLSFEKQIIQESSLSTNSIGGTSGVSLITINVVGRMGLDKWFSSDVGFTFSYQSDDIAEIKYMIDDGPVQNYTEPFYITEEGWDRCLEWFAVDHWGNQSDVDGPFIFDLDQTDPNIDIAFEVVGGDPKEGWDFLFTATSTDDMSGMERVEFYLNDELQDTVYGAGPTYQWDYKYYGDIAISVYATAFDNAGNSAIDYIPSPLNMAILESIIFHTDIDNESSINGCLDDVLSSEIVEIEEYRVIEKLNSGTYLGGVFDPAYIIVVFDIEEMGENDWIVGDVSFPIFYESDRIAEVYYQIDNEGWMLYVEPLVISDDGAHSFMWYVVDSEGHTSIQDSISFKIDQTCPEINLIKKRIGLTEVKFIADVHDEASGINRVHFDGTRGTGEYTDYDYPYEWVWLGDDWLDIFFGSVWVTVYDNAGHKKRCHMGTRGSSSFNQQSTIAQSGEFLQGTETINR